MTLPLEKKRALLSDFHNCLYKEGWTFTESGEGEKDRVLLCEFDIVIKEFLELRPVCLCMCDRAVWFYACMRACQCL